MPGTHLESGMLVFTHFIAYKCFGQNLIIPHLNGMCYGNLKDLNIGIMFIISERGNTNSQHCSSNIALEGAAETVEFFKYALMDINKNNTILPNISLGYVFTDTCNTDLVSLARALYFVPRDTQNSKQRQNVFVEECGMNRLAVYSYLTRYTHEKTIELTSCSHNLCTKIY